MHLHDSGRANGNTSTTDNSDRTDQKRWIERVGREITWIGPKPERTTHATTDHRGILTETGLLPFGRRDLDEGLCCFVGTSM
jgi:hypothetical protein